MRESISHGDYIVKIILVIVLVAVELLLILIVLGDIIDPGGHYAIASDMIAILGAISLIITIKPVKKFLNIILRFGFLGNISVIVLVITFITIVTIYLLRIINYDGILTNIIGLVCLNISIILYCMSLPKEENDNKEEKEGK